MVPDKSVKCRGQVHIALGMKQEDKRGDIAGLMSGTGRSEKALHSGGGGRGSRQGSVGSPQRCLGLRRHTAIIRAFCGSVCQSGTVGRILRPQAQMAVWDRAGSSVLHSCKADGEEGRWVVPEVPRHSCLLPLVLRATLSTHFFTRGLPVLPSSASCGKLTEADRAGRGLQ